MDFIARHIGPNNQEQEQMLAYLGFASLNDFIKQVVPNNLLSKTDMLFKAPENEFNALAKLKQIMHKNKLYKNYIGLGYYETILPSVIKRNVLENPGWYTAYTPYQAEISQGRLEALLNFQQMIMDLTGFSLANASLLDEATAAAESMLMAYRMNNANGNSYFVDEQVLPQSLAVIKTRAHYAGIKVIVGKVNRLNAKEYFGVLIQNPNVMGEIKDYTALINKFKLHNPNLIVSMACDILSLVLFTSPYQQGADIALGSCQRFGVPLGFGGPAAAYMATHEANKRNLPGRIIGLSVDSRGKKALRMSLQTREQHIRREKATSNICTAQVLLANLAAFYAIYHGYRGLLAIATKIHHLSLILAHNLIKAGFNLVTDCLFDTIAISGNNLAEIYDRLMARGYLVGRYANKLLISLGEKTEIEDVVAIIECFNQKQLPLELAIQAIKPLLNKGKSLYRQDAILTHLVFNSYHSETKMMRYLKYLENKDISLVHSMIPLGSCTMKLNAASELEPLAWEQIANLHPFAPAGLTKGYLQLIKEFKQYLMAITGFAEISLQPNSGAQGEYAGLLAIRRYQDSIQQGQRNICLIPKSAHGTNPATAQMIGMEVVMVECDNNGNIDVDDLKAKAIKHQDNLSCLMVTYPSTHGVFEAAIKQMCQIIHAYGGQVYMDGANLNALVGLIKPAELGADVSHLNLHKTFAIPHGGGGPGMGPIGVRAHLIPFLPTHPLANDLMVQNDCNTVSAAPYGSASILSISWMYITLLGGIGLSFATKIAILNANYIKAKLSPYFPILYTGQHQWVAHECIIDLRPLKLETGITEVDIAKRLMDYGFHAPTMSFPVPGTLMIEPTESEAKDELDRFIEAMLSIYTEIQAVKNGNYAKTNNPLKNAPHTLADIINWDKPYSIAIGCFPLPYLQQNKVFPSVNRIDDAHGDRNFMCSCFDFNS